MRRGVLIALLSVIAPSGCSKKETPPEPHAVVSVKAPDEPPPAVLYLPDADTPRTAAPGRGPLLIPGLASGRCPAEMVDVQGRFCIDRYEVGLVDARTERPLSPYYHPKAGQVQRTYARWQKQRLEAGSARARSAELPDPPEWQLTDGFQPKAISRRGLVPSGYLNRELAELSCKNAGKRLCTADEWVTACRGQDARKFPYGQVYASGACNVHRDTHPAAVLHGNASIGHLDPRLNQVEASDGPLLRPTGTTESCRSQWGSDGIYDMVGNLDEWVDDPDGAFHGGFYSRGTKEGCDARIASHPPQYFDYSLGTRCCL